MDYDDNLWIMMNPRIIVNLGLKTSFRSVFSQCFERTPGVHINFFLKYVDYGYSLQIMMIIHRLWDYTALWVALWVALLHNLQIML